MDPNLKKFSLEAQDSVFVLIDIQEKLMAAMKYRDQVYRNHQTLMALATQMDIPVVKCEQYPRGLGPTVPEIAEFLPTNHYSVEKVCFSAGPAGLLDTLQELQRKTVLISGSETHVCVFQTTRDLLEAGYTVHVIRDAVCSRFKENYLSGLQLMDKMGAVINNTETIAFDLLRGSDHPAFKVISAAVK
jgi:nicotinamidase-related amidase